FKISIVNGIQHERYVHSQVFLKIKNNCGSF
ncbi:unnamed protein product, partial [Allacma fusca]